MNATARWTPERCEVWTPTQNGEAALAAAAEAAGPAAGAVRGLQDPPRRRLRPARRGARLGAPGGGDRQGDARHAGQADLVARGGHAARPLPPDHAVQADAPGSTRRATSPRCTCASRASRSSPASFRRTSSDGKDPVVFQGLNAGGGRRRRSATAFPNLLIDHAMRNPHVPPGFWRGVNLNQNTIYLECFIDEIAHATKQDPLALRRKLMANHPKHLAVLNAVAERAGWGTPAPTSAARRSSAAWRRRMGFGSYVAACAEVSVSDDGELKIHRIVAATDPRPRGQPAADRGAGRGLVRLRPVGGAVRRVHGQGRRASSRTTSTPTRCCGWTRCRRSRRSSMPSGGFWGGVGEPTIAVAAPAVLNAIFAATGKRIRDLPLEEPQPEEGLIGTAPCAGACWPCGRRRAVPRRRARRRRRDRAAADRRRRATPRAAAPSSPAGSTGLCLLCHAAPIPEERFQGNLGARPGRRRRALERRRSCGCAWSTPRRLNPAAIMPAYHRTDGLQRVGARLAGQADARRAAGRGRGRLPGDAEVSRAMTPTDALRRRRCCSPAARGVALGAPGARAQAAGAGRGGRAPSPAAAPPRAGPRDARHRAAGRERQRGADHGRGREPDDRGRPRDARSRSSTSATRSATSRGSTLGPRAGRAEVVHAHPPGDHRSSWSRWRG